MPGTPWAIALGRRLDVTGDGPNAAALGGMHSVYSVRGGPSNDASQSTSTKSLASGDAGPGVTPSAPSRARRWRATSWQCADVSSRGSTRA